MTGVIENTAKSKLLQTLGRPPSCGKRLMGLKSKRHFLSYCAHCKMTATDLLLDLFQLDPHVKIEYF